MSIIASPGRCIFCKPVVLCNNNKPVILNLSSVQPIVAKMFAADREFGTSAEVSVRHFGTGAELSGHFGTIRGAEMSWVRSVLGSKCLDTRNSMKNYLQSQR